MRFVGTSAPRIIAVVSWQRVLQLVGLCKFSGWVAHLVLGFGKLAAHDGNALDEFRQALHEQDRKGERDEELGGPLRQARCSRRWTARAVCWSWMPRAGPRGCAASRTGSWSDRW